MVGKVLDVPVLHDILKHIVLLVVRVECFLLLGCQHVLLFQLSLKVKKRRFNKTIQPRFKATVLCFKEQQQQKKSPNTGLYLNGARTIMNVKKDMLTSLVPIAYTDKVFTFT
jgi:hypothetical protein